MDQLNQLWGRRCSRHFQMELRYWNLIGKNSGLMFFLYAMVIIGGFYYKKWLDGLPQDFPAALLLSVILALFVMRSPIRTFMQQADLVFLLPAEAELEPYFRKSRFYSFSIQIAAVIVVMIVCGPLYFHMKGSSGLSYFILTATAVALKGWNIDCHWKEMLIDYSQPLKILRFTLTFLLLYSVANQYPFYSTAACAAVILIASVFLFHRQSRSGLLSWKRIVEMEERQAMQFLRFANLFTDVPRLKHHIHARKMISRLFPIRSLSSKNVYRQLYIKTFIRSDDYFSSYIRLTLIGMLVCYFMNIGFYTVFVVASLIYLTGLQLLPLWTHPFPQALAGMYPIPERLRKQSFIQLVFILLTAETVVVSLSGAVRSAGVEGIFLFLLAGGAVSVLFPFFYVAHRIAGQDKA
ncbi:ABC transporter permease [Sporolactobacillus shoreae]|uniref:ABC transporter permease n=1 Tax=Sporolactobacillus shoreae TaxID=1465501 RepID=A0A4Z0GQ61_9BACL|nr:ABC transporter permease [Sporolactobacillus shoreae]TGA99182.1 ABC transporter permease [Sporolactobacillus shoreae]